MARENTADQEVDLNESREEPKFGFEEIFEDYIVLRTVSYGGGSFRERHTVESGLIFQVNKDRLSNKLVVKVFTKNLRSLLSHALGWPDPPFVNEADELDVFKLLPYYMALKLFLHKLEEESGQGRTVAEFRLFCQDLLLDSSVFNGLFNSSLYTSIISPLHRQDMQRWQTRACLDDIDHGFDIISDDTSYELPFACSCRLESEKEVSNRLRESKGFDLTDFEAPSMHNGIIHALRHFSQSRSNLFDDLVHALINSGYQPLKAALSAHMLLGRRKVKMKIWRYFYEPNPVDEINAGHTCFEVKICGVEEYLHKSKIEIEITNQSWAGYRGRHCDTLAKCLASLGVYCQEMYRSVFIPKILQGDVRFVNRWVINHPSWEIGPECLKAALVAKQYGVWRPLLANGKALDPEKFFKVFKRTELLTYLCAATRDGHEDVIRSLLNFLANSGKLYFIRDTKKADSHSPLVIAAENGRTELVRCYLKYNFYLGTDLETALYKAVKHGYIEIVELLMNEGTTFLQVAGLWEENQLAVSPWAALMAIHHGHTDIVQYFINEGVEVEPEELQTQPTIPLDSNKSRDEGLTDVLDAIKTRDRLMMQKLTHDIFTSRHSRFLDLMESSSDTELSSLSLEFERRRTVWKEGMTYIKDLFNNRAGSEAKRVFCCLQVASAMQLAGIAFKKRQKRIKGEPCDFPEKITDQSFIDDLARWRTLVAPNELPLYDKLVYAVWEPQGDLSSFILLCSPDEVLLSFQELISKLVNETGISETSRPLDYPPGERLHVLQNRHAHKMNIAHAQPLQPKCQKFCNEPLDSPIQPTFLNPAQPRIVYVMIGVIFGAIIYALLVFQRPSDKIITEDAHPSRLDQLNFGRRNCIWLLMFIDSLTHVVTREGPTSCDENTSSSVSSSSSSASPSILHSSPLESVESSGGGGSETCFNTSPPDTSSPLFPCPSCNKRFTKIGKRNWHLKYDCKRGSRIKFRCNNPGCEGEFSRKVYRDIHQVRTCRNRTV